VGKAKHSAPESQSSAVLLIEREITTNAPPYDQPWPPRFGDGWFLVRDLPGGKTLWRRISWPGARANES
jgi:hypothetical protein